MELGIPELTNEQIEEACATAEEAARNYVFLKIGQKQVETLNISVEAEGTKPLTFLVEVDFQLKPTAEEIEQKKTAAEAIQQAFEAIENYLERLK